MLTSELLAVEQFIIFIQNMAVQNELLNLLQAESEATVVYAAIVLSQVRKEYSRIYFLILKRHTLYYFEAYFYIHFSIDLIDTIARTQK